MPKSIHQKLKLLYIIKILEEETDENTPIPTVDLIEKLAAYEISAERKSIYDDIKQLQDFGYDIGYNGARIGGGYYMASRDFELPELKLLVDAVQASRYISTKKSRQLISKLEMLTSKENAKQLSRQVTVANRIKTDNESIYYAVDVIHRAMQDNAQISFRYLEWNKDKKLVPRKSGKIYEISPWALTCKDENYYMIGFDAENDMIKHYRVDKLGNVQIMENRARQGKASFERFDLAAYTNHTFGMFAGKEETVTLEVAESSLGILIDRFGKDIAVRPDEGEMLKVRVQAAVSPQFFGWLAGVGSVVKIVSPEAVKVQYKEYLSRILQEL